MLSECFCVVDSREKNTKRIESVKEFMESHGGAVEFGALPLCDYKIEGIFREKEICIGIEAKSLTDFSGSYQDLPDKLARSFELYNDVALFVEIPQIKTSSCDGFHATILNPAVVDGSADVLQYAVLQNSLESWQREGVHVRQLQSESLWGYAIASVLISITKDTHRGLEITKVKDYKSQYLNILSKFEGIGQKTALKIIKYYPNFYWLCTMHEDHLKEKLGKVTGSKLHKFLTNNELYTADWLAGNTEPCESTKDKEKCAISHPEQSLVGSNQDIPKTPLEKLVAETWHKKYVQKEKNIEKIINEEPKNPELAYLDENKPKFKEVSRRTITNGKLDIKGLIPEDNALVIKYKPFVLGFLQHNPSGIEYKDIQRTLVEKMASNAENMFGMPSSIILEHIVHQLLTDGEIYEPKLGLLVATNPLQLSRLPAESHSDTDSRKVETTEANEHNPASQTLAGAGSNLPDAPSNDEFTANPRLKDIVEFIRRHPRTLDDVGKEFGLSPEYCLKALYALKDEHKKIWFEKSSCTWQFGIDKNPAPVVADKEYEVM